MEVREYSSAVSLVTTTASLSSASDHVQHGEGVGQRFTSSA